MKKAGPLEFKLYKIRFLSNHFTATGLNSNQHQLLLFFFFFFFFHTVTQPTAQFTYEIKFYKTHERSFVIRLC